jgi:hypothetical protein
VKRSLLLLPAVLIALAVAGCGTSDKDKVKNVVQSYVDGLATNNGKAVCDQLAGSVQTQVKTRASAKSCAAAITSFQKSALGKAVAPAFKTAKIDQIQVKGNNATAQLTVKVAGKDTPVTVPLEKVSGDWKISSTNTG